LIVFVFGFAHFFTSFDINRTFQNLSKYFSPSSIKLLYIFFFCFFWSFMRKLLEVRLNIGDILLTPVFFISGLFISIGNICVTSVLSIINFTIVLSLITFNFVIFHVTFVVFKKIFSQIWNLVAGNFTIPIMVINVDFTIFQIEFTFMNLSFGFHIGW